VAIDHDRIVAVGESSSPAIRDLLPAARDLGDVAILPGLINSHTHLEFSDCNRPLGTDGMVFPDWIRLVVEHQQRRRAQLRVRSRVPPQIDRLQNALRSGIVESKYSSITTIGDIESGINSTFRSDVFEEHLPPFELINFLEVIALKERQTGDAAKHLS